MRARDIFGGPILRRAAVLAYLLRRGGYDASVVIGVRRRDAGSLEAHAWLACDGRDPFLEPSDSIATFQPLNRA